MWHVVKLLAGKAAAVPLPLITKGRRVVLVAPSRAMLKEAVESWGAKGLLALDQHHQGDERRDGTLVRRHYGRVKDVHSNNCEVAVLDKRSSLILTKKRKFERFSTILLPTGLCALAASVGLMRYGSRGELALAGQTQITVGGRLKKYLVLEVRSRNFDQRRQYAPAGMTPLEILRSINDLDVVLLRGAEAIAAGRHSGDIDVLVSARDVNTLKSRFEAEIGTYPVDVYTCDGSGGFNYNGAPYFAPKVAARLVEHALTDGAGIKVPSPRWQFVSYCYHLLYHAKLNPGADRQELTERSFVKPSNFHDLAGYARAAGRAAPQTIEEIEKILEDEDAMPSLDLIGFYSNSDPFLQQRYFARSSVPAGLSTFFLRDFGLGPDATIAVRRHLQKGFTVLAEGPVTAAIRDAVRHGVRGGNWTDKTVAGGRAEAIYWFVCWDDSPKSPSRRLRKKYPRLDNENVRIKDTIRGSLGQAGNGTRGLVHSSDNTEEALDHLEVLGLANDPTLRAFLQSKGITPR